MFLLGSATPTEIEVLPGHIGANQMPDHHTNREARLPSQRSSGRSSNQATCGDARSRPYMALGGRLIAGGNQRHKDRSHPIQDRALNLSHVSNTSKAISKKRTPYIRIEEGKDSEPSRRRRSHISQPLRRSQRIANQGTRQEADQHLCAVDLRYTTVAKRGQQIDRRPKRNLAVKSGRVSKGPKKLSGRKRRQWFNGQ